jgi:2-oxoglutarate dehydrogenase complex dehydrogenase (E1) component-like enzyme
MFTFLIKRQLKKDAEQLARTFHEHFPELKDEKNQEIIQKKLMRTFNENIIKKWTDKERKFLQICCRTPNGYCYMMGFNDGYKKKMINIRSIEFTNYVDKELEKLGYRQQTLEQKKEIIDALGFIDAFERYLKLKN